MRIGQVSGVSARSHAGHPIVGDKIYALSGDVRDEMLRDGRG